MTLYTTAIHNNKQITIIIPMGDHSPSWDFDTAANQIGIEVKAAVENAEFAR